VHRDSRLSRPMSGLGHSRRYWHVRSLVRYPQHRTLPRPTETRPLVAFLRPICKQRARPRQFLRLASLDLATRDARAVTKIRRIDCNELAQNLRPRCLVCIAELKAIRDQAPLTQSGLRVRWNGSVRPSHRRPSRPSPGRPGRVCGPRAAATAAITSARSPSASKSVRKKFASWGRKAYSCVRSSPLRAKKRRVLACPVLYRSGAPEGIRTPDPQIRRPRARLPARAHSR
jgi:hypothetical protein